MQVREPQPEAAAPAAEAVEGEVADAAAPAAEAPAVDPQLAALEQSLSERTLDLQRLQAEYVNYKRRVDRDREVSRAAGVESVLRDLLAVLDDVRSAREHGELTGAFKAVGEGVEKVTARHGLTSFGEAGEPFDPQVHEALMHAYAEDVTEPTCVQVLQVGYRVGERVLRPARVAVAEPAAPSDDQSSSEQS
nr:nucleotide exchange factor GrpE [Auraticoccus cholistanensis]